MPKIDLLPCPFCGGTDLHLESFSGWGADVVICRGCLATFSQQEITCEEDLIEAWNTRASGWIPCGERLPEEYEDVLVAMKSGEYKSIHIGYAYSSGDWMIDGEFWYEEGDPSITHWMPLPEMPKGEER